MIIFDISSIKSFGPTQKLGLRGGFETTSKEKSMRIKILLDNDLPIDLCGGT
jgi:hypothetical protein